LPGPPPRLLPLHLKSRRKYNCKDGLLSRTKSADDTFADLIPIAKKIGLTRLSDITYLDKLYIPNFSAILPGTEDSIWVYSGKGPTKADARAGALMEAIERYSSLYDIHLSSFIQGTFSQLSKCYDKVLHPAEVVEPVRDAYRTNGSILDFLPGFDLLANEEVLVPSQLALSRYSPRYPATCAFMFSHTNGIASGNVVEEAICHALCEVIERDAISIADLCASFIPYTVLEKVKNSLKENTANRYPIASISENLFVDDPSIFPDVDISEITKECKPIRFLVGRFTDCGIPLLIKDITQKDIGIPTFVASSAEWITGSYGYFAKGFGANPDARIALIRAITEVSQTRAVNIQGARDDLRKIKYEQKDEIYKRKWQFMPASSSSSSRRNKTIKFSEVRTYANKDILDDIKLILESLKNAGLKRAIIIDLTDPKVRIPVVRSIIPGLETFEVGKLFMQNESVMGTRARKRFVETLKLQ
jgi:ribosomal protein S12 methylthiotransferase accessory factor YcaO